MSSGQHFIKNDPEREEITALTTYNILLAQLYFSEGTLLERRNVLLARNIQESTPWYARF